MPNLANRFPHYLLSNVVYEPISGHRGSSATSIGDNHATSTHHLERKQRIESIASAYLQGKMPRLSSTSSRAPRVTGPLPSNPRPDITYEPVSATRPNASRRASNNVGVEEERAAKRRRIEAIAKAYNQGKMPVIQSASLRGPLEKDWKNPWAKTSTGRGSSAATPRPRPVQEFDTIVVSVPRLVPLLSSSRNQTSDLSSLSPSLQQSVADHDREASEITAINHPFPKCAVANAYLREDGSRPGAQDTEERTLHEPNRSENIIVMPTEDTSSANTTTATPMLAAEKHTHPSIINEDRRKKLARKDGKKPSTTPRVGESPFSFRYQKDMSKEKEAGKVNALEGNNSNEPDILPKKKRPRRMNFDSSQVVPEDNQLERRSQRKQPSALTSEPQDTTTSVPRNEDAIENSTGFANMKATTGLPGVVSAGETAPPLSPPPSLDNSTNRPLPTQRGNITVTPRPEVDKDPANSGKKRKKRAAIETNEATPAPELEIDQEPEPHSLRNESHPHTIAALDTSNVASNKRKTEKNRVDSATHQATNGAPLTLPATLESPESSAIRSKTRNKQKIGSLVAEASTPRQTKKVQVSRLSTQADEEDILERIVVKPRMNQSRIQSTMPPTGTESPPRQMTEATEVEITSQKGPKVDAAVGAPMNDETLSTEQIIHMAAVQDEPESRPRKRKSRPSALDSTAVVSSVSVKKKRKQQRTGPVPDPAVNGDTGADVEIDDGNLPQEAASGQQAFNGPRTPTRTKRSQPASSHSPDVPRTRSQRNQAQTPSNAMSPEIQQEFLRIVDSIHSAHDVQSETDEDLDSTIDCIASGIIPFSIFKTGVANRNIQAAMEIKQPLSTQQLFEAQSPLAFSTEKKRRIQERFGPPPHDETEYLDTQALFDAAGGNTPHSDTNDMDVEETPVKSKSRRKSRRGLALQEKPSSSTFNTSSDSLRKSSRLRGKDSPYLEHDLHLSQPSQQSEVDFSFMNSLLQMSPVNTRVQE
ncbi:uncharacterized protein BDZ99DRAFT_543696 [Mytilinidion resinicola]|uniref:Uncharacterized protein n=1 Tax=Mytilinidion resinicola TaxID=574789 RepID=A0A6A6Y830_9PEZI|nr:uncharacterized protein BDZ99DRAFT_543696 [Mytilinidion resinicola]KAF2804840.1 hypothetical protein BDZ99DRAFT_543696 [Mytilinidion resinicola]